MCLWHINISIKIAYIDGLVQDCNYSSAFAVEWLQSCTKPLTHWGRNKMAAVSQTTLSNAFSWMKMLWLRLKFHWSLFLRFELTIFQHICVTPPQWVDMMSVRKLRRKFYILMKKKYFERKDIFQTKISNLNLYVAIHVAHVFCILMRMWFSSVSLWFIYRDSFFNFSILFNSFLSFSILFNSVLSYELVWLHNDNSL